MLRGFTFTFILLLSVVCAVAQKTFSISGTVKDNKETLPGAAIYLSGYKMATTTNNDGKFVLSNLQPGTYDVLVQMIGYAPTSKNVVITDQSAQVTITLQENATMLSEVVIKADPNRAAHLAMFKNFFIGETANAQKCKILNTDVLITNDDKANRLLTIKAKDLIIIENLALGYRIKYLLSAFEYDYKNNITYYAGQPAFEEMKGGSAKQKRWKKEREIAFQGSSDHFLKSLINNRLQAEGFELFKRSEKKNDSRPSDSLINAKIKPLISGRNGVVNLIQYNGGNDSLSYWMNKKKEPKSFKILNKVPVLVDTLLKREDNIFKSMAFGDELYIVFKNEEEPKDFSFSPHKQSRPLDFANYQISVIARIEPKIFLYPNGAVANPRSILYSGVWGYQKVADSVPMDYVSQTKK